MVVFIGWSGERSKQLARILYEWLPLVLHPVVPWMSATDIAAGQRWGLELAKALDEAQYGIICLTAENINERWILFEAGCLAKSLDEAKVIPILLDMDPGLISPPLGQFQGKKADSVGLKELVNSLLQETDENAERVAKLIEHTLVDVIKQISNIAPIQAERLSRTDREMLEELVIGTRAIDTRLLSVERTLAQQMPRTLLFPGQRSTAAASIALANAEEQLNKLSSYEVPHRAARNVLRAITMGDAQRAYAWLGHLDRARNNMRPDHPEYVEADAEELAAAREQVGNLFYHLVELAENLALLTGKVRGESDPSP